MRKMTTFLKLSALGALFLGVVGLYSCKKTPTEETLAAPTNAKITDITSVGAKLMWDAVEGAELYEIQGTGGIPSEPETVSGTSKTYTTLQPNTPVTWEVRAVKGSTKSAWATGESFTTLTPTIPAPTNLRHADLKPTSVNLVWDAAAGAEKYLLVVTGGGRIEETPIEVTEGESESLSDLEPDVTYTWSVKTVIGGFQSEPISGGFTTPEVSNPTNARASEVLMESATLTWTPGEFETEYVIKINQLNEGAEFTVTGNSHRVEGLAPNTNYSWQIKGKLGDYRASAFVDGEAFTTEAVQTPVPTGLTATEVTHNSAKLSWQHVDADSHEVRLNNGTAIAVTGLTYTATGLDPETVYSWQVRSTKDGVWSDWATAAETFTTGVAPRVVAPPTNVRIDMTLSGTTRVAVRWTPSVDADVNGYWVQVEEASIEYNNSGWLAETGTAPGINAGGTFRTGVTYKCRVMSLVNWRITPDNFIDWDEESVWVDVPNFTISAPDPDFGTRLGNYTGTGTPSWFQEQGPSTWSGAVEAVVFGTVYGVTNIFNANEDQGVDWANLYIISTEGKLMLDDVSAIASGTLPTGERLELFIKAFKFEGDEAYVAEPGQIEIAWNAATRKFTFPGGSDLGYGLAEYMDGEFTGDLYSDLYQNLVLTVAASGGVAPKISGTRIEAQTKPMPNGLMKGSAVNNVSRKVASAKTGLRYTYSGVGNSKLVSKRTNYVER